MKLLALVPLFALVLPQATMGATKRVRVVPPHEVIQQASDELLEAIAGKRETLQANPDALYEIVDNVLRNRFDVRYSARLVMTKHWAGTTEDMREKFMEALYGSLVRRYSSSLLDHSNTRVRVTPLRLGLPDPDEEEFETVRTTVTLDNGTDVPVLYEMRLVDSVWMVYDVKIEGRSYVAHFREVFRDEIDEKGLRQVIEDLNGP